MGDKCEKHAVALRWLADASAPLAIAFWSHATLAVEPNKARYSAHFVSGVDCCCKERRQQKEKRGLNTRSYTDQSKPTLVWVECGMQRAPHTVEYLSLNSLALLAIIHCSALQYRSCDVKRGSPKKGKGNRHHPKQSQASPQQSLGYTLVEHLHVLWVMAPLYNRTPNSPRMWPKPELESCLF